MQEIGIISILDKQWEYTKESTEMYCKWVTSMSFIFFFAFALWTADINEKQEMGL